MPVKSSSSSIIRWPDRDAVLRAFFQWARETLRSRPEVLRIGCYGSYARGDWGVGSDLDIVVIVGRSELPPERRALAFSKEHLPVPVDLLVYTLEEWEALSASGSRFAATVSREAVWAPDRLEDG